MDDHPLDIPRFLKISAEDRKRAWAEYDDQRHWHHAAKAESIAHMRKPGDIAADWVRRRHALIKGD